MSPAPSGAISDLCASSTAYAKQLGSGQGWVALGDCEAFFGCLWLGVLCDAQSTLCELQATACLSTMISPKAGTLLTLLSKHLVMVVLLCAGTVWQCSGRANDQRTVALVHWLFATYWLHMRDRRPFASACCRDRT